jgi:hypothetical protein
MEHPTTRYEADLWAGKCYSIIFPTRLYQVSEQTTTTLRLMREKNPFHECTSISSQDYDNTILPQLSTVCFTSSIVLPNIFCANSISLPIMEPTLIVEPGFFENFVHHPDLASTTIPRDQRQSLADVIRESDDPLPHRIHPVCTSEYRPQKLR